METLVIIGGLTALVILLAYLQGKKTVENSLQREVLEDVKRTKELRRSLRNKHVRDKLRNIFK